MGWFLRFKKMNNEILLFLEFLAEGKKEQLCLVHCNDGQPQLPKKKVIRNRVLGRMG